MNRLLIDAEYVLEQYELLRRKAIQVYGLHAQSGAKLPPVPFESCHSFRGKVATHSGNRLPFFGCFPERVGGPVIHFL